MLEKRLRENDVIHIFHKLYIGILPLRLFDVRMTSSYNNFIPAFVFKIQKYSLVPDLSRLKPMSCQICKSLNFSISQHIRNERLPWQQLRSVKIIIYICKMTLKGVKLNLKYLI